MHIISVELFKYTTQSVHTHTRTESVHTHTRIFIELFMHVYILINCYSTSQLIVHPAHSVHIYIYILYELYVCMYVYVCIYIYIYIYCQPPVRLPCPPLCPLLSVLLPLSCLPLPSVCHLATIGKSHSSLHTPPSIDIYTHLMYKTLYKYK
eukprot:GHVQ01016881.1.p1 GENE.GHVQ01016881.1~~GHVQ01016881.1.p1  ORF type:complete len:151 (-),score=5.42 GHVQ01016881.1:273-725(-)